MPSYKVPERKKKHEELVFDDRMQTIAAEYAALGYTYVPSSQEKEQLIFEKYKQRFKHTYNYTVQQAFRIKHRNEEYIVYRIAEEVTDSNNQIHRYEGQKGWRTSPIVESAGRDEFGESTGSKITGHRLVYEIPFDKQFVRDLFEKSEEHPACLAVGRGSQYPPDIISSNVMSVFNEEEFIECDFEDLVEANAAGFLRPDYGGVKAYQASRQQQQQQQQQNVTK